MLAQFWFFNTESGEYLGEGLHELGGVQAGSGKRRQVPAAGGPAQSGATLVTCAVRAAGPPASFPPPAAAAHLATASAAAASARKATGGTAVAALASGRINSCSAAQSRSAPGSSSGSFTALRTSPNSEAPTLVSSPPGTSGRKTFQFSYSISSSSSPIAWSTCACGARQQAGSLVRGLGEPGAHGPEPRSAGAPGRGVRTMRAGGVASHQGIGRGPHCRHTAVQAWTRLKVKVTSAREGVRRAARDAVGLTDADLQRSARAELPALQADPQCLPNRERIGSRLLRSQAGAAGRRRGLAAPLGSTTTAP